MNLIQSLFLFAFVLINESECYKDRRYHDDDYDDYYADYHNPRDDYYNKTNHVYERPRYRYPYERNRHGPHFLNYAVRSSDKKSGRAGRLAPTCLKNEEYRECGNECNRHCRDVTGVPAGIKCPILQCDKWSDGCFCKEGFFRKDTTGECVTRSECSSPLQTNNDSDSTNSRNKASKKAEASRKVRENPKSRAAKPKKKTRNMSGMSLILKDPIDCSHNEIYSSCGTDCGQTCADLGTDALHCPKTCRDGCFCLNGYYRNSAGICVQKNNC